MLGNIMIMLFLAVLQLALHWQFIPTEKVNNNKKTNKQTEKVLFKAAAPDEL